ncbi:alpha-tocopherol transfer protein-like [Harmonia axyridis]|uniref:alpha-tocopherol transfer protein-like n=1 Tax=Harmonia axyridis TaxID=115357 RepID=UPI001E278BF8|nr:alpha-tocopherol transfer protein-like [Harmonia axyridis]XP_045467871.1 alpha-tocopherol transfer protein-like [Harmonia axyridis]XP_045467872.1 alpha-tocopherol transfer protein-like [Harmonia axyridis]
MEENSSETNQRIKALECLGTNEDEADKKISLIEEWIEGKNFPEKLKKNIIEMFLIRNKFKVDVTQKRIAMYYKIRSQIPEFFEEKHPRENHMKQVMNVSHFVFSPKLTPELYTVNFFRLIDVNPKSFIPNDFCGFVVNIAELKLVHDVYSLGDIYVCDLKGTSFSHLYYFGVGTLRKLAKVIQEAFPVSIKAIHFVNSPGYMNTLIAIIKNVLNPKIFKRIHVHENCEDVANFVSKDILPKEFGGVGAPLDDLSDLLRGKFLEFQSRFDELEKVNEKMKKK